MKRFYHILIIFLIFGILFSVAQPLSQVNAQVIPCPQLGGLCFGGYITFVFPCLNGILTFVYGIPFMWVYGTPIVGIPPNHIGQGILGSASGFLPCLIPCPPPVFICPYGGGPIMFPLPLTGTSLI